MRCERKSTFEASVQGLNSHISYDRYLRRAASFYILQCYIDNHCRMYGLCPGIVRDAQHYDAAGTCAYH